MIRTMATNELFPVFIKLHQFKVLVVGGGYVAWEKLQAILSNSPETRVTVVGETVSDEIYQLASEKPTIKVIERSFQAADLHQIDLAFLATNCRETNKGIRALAKAQRIWVNVADTPDLCDFYLGSVVKKGNLKIGISTNGKSPTFAKRFRQLLEESLPGQTDELLKNLNILRDRLKGDFSHKVQELNKHTASLLTPVAEKE